MIAKLTVDARKLKMIREALCVAQSLMINVNGGREASRSKSLELLIDQIDLHRPLGPDCKHGLLHTPTCGCEDK